MEEVLLDKDGTKIVKYDKGCYTINFEFFNPNIILANVVGFDLFKLIHDLNPDICEKIEIQKIDETNALMTSLIKNFFEDLGFAQKFSCLQVKKEYIKDYFIFSFKTYSKYRPKWITDDDIELGHLDGITLICVPQNDHYMKLCCKVEYSEENDVPVFVQKTSIMMINKIINRLKQFIENVKV
jgi:hypothetical protein